MKKLIILFLILSFQMSFAFPFFKNKKGTMTGYSTPITNDVFKDLGIEGNDKKNRLKSPKVMTDIFSVPQTNYGYDKNNALKGNQTEGIGVKTGVTIIYD